MSGRELESAEGGVLGNVYDKYGTSNPIAKWLMGGFLASTLELYAHAAPRSVLEVGCGEGKLADYLMREGPSPETFEASDVSLEALAEDLDPRIQFREASIYDLPYEDASIDLVLCCEVLEHLQEPAAALAEVARVARSRVLLSTPREPLWRGLNMLRGKYLAQAGNTPGHIQHFSHSSLMALASTRLDVLEVRTPPPWTMILGAPTVCISVRGSGSPAAFSRRTSRRRSAASGLSAARSPGPRSGRPSGGNELEPNARGLPAR